MNIEEDKELVEYEGKMITKELRDSLIDFYKEYEKYIIKRPESVKKDSKGRDINQKGKPSYVRILIEGDKNIVLMKSIDNTSINAKLWYPLEGCWKINSKMWVEHVDYGSEGIDYIYIC